MKYMILNQNGEKLQIPGAYLEKSGLSENTKLDAHVLDQALVVLPQQLTAMETVQAMNSLMSIIFDMFACLTKDCNTCDVCSTKGRCEFKENIWTSELKLSPKGCKEFGFAENMGIRFEVDEKNNRIKISMAETTPGPSLIDMPVWMREMFIGMGFCLGDLDELIRSEDIIYGNG